MKLYLIHNRAFEIKVRKGEEGPFRDVVYSREEMLSSFSREDDYIAFSTENEAKEYVKKDTVKGSGIYSSYGIETYWVMQSPILIVEVPDWVVLIQELVPYDQKLSPWQEKEKEKKRYPKINGRFIQKIIAVVLDGQEALSVPESSDNWKWIKRSVIITAIFVVGFLLGGIQWWGALIVGGVSFILSALIKKGINYFQGSYKSDEDVMESNIAHDQIDLPVNKQEFKRISRPNGSPFYESKNAQDNNENYLELIQRHLSRYEQQKGYTYRFLGDHNDIKKLKLIVGEAHATETNEFSSKLTFNLCKTLLEITVTKKCMVSDLIIKIKRDMLRIKDKYPPLAVAQFLQYYNLLNQSNFDRLCISSYEEQNAIIKFMQNLPRLDAKRSQAIFNILCDHVRDIEFSDEKRIFNSYVGEFYSAYSNMPAALCTPENIKRMFMLGYCKIGLLGRIVRRLPLLLLSQENINLIFNEFDKKSDNDNLFSIAYVPVKLIKQTNFRDLCLRPKIGRAFILFPDELRTQKYLDILLGFEDDTLFLIELGMKYYVKDYPYNDLSHLPKELIPFMIKINHQHSRRYQLQNPLSIKDYLFHLLEHAYALAKRPQMEALCQGLHPRLGENCWARLLAGRGQVLPKDPMVAISDRNLVVGIRQFI